MGVTQLLQRFNDMTVPLVDVDDLHNCDGYLQVGAMVERSGELGRATTHEASSGVRAGIAEGSRAASKEPSPCHAPPFV